MAIGKMKTLVIQILRAWDKDTQKQGCVCVCVCVCVCEFQNLLVSQGTGKRASG